jgi:hypothetical protein
LTPTLSPAVHSAMLSMLHCCTSDLKRRFGILAGLAVAFTVGYERSLAIISSTEPTERISIEEKKIDVRLIRGGERGLLFKSFETGKLGFLRWEKIKQIDSF